MHAADTVVTGTVVTQEGVFPDSCVAVKDGRVAGLLSAGSAPRAEEELDYRECLISPRTAAPGLGVDALRGHAFMGIRS